MDEAGADALYGLPLADFTAERNALAARLRKAGDRASSDAVKGLAKPSITAWALNQVARSQPALVDRLLEVAEDLRKAQQALLAGRGQAGFREASQAERAAVAALVKAAAAVLDAGGHPAAKPVLDRLEATTRAAVADPQAADRLQVGRLTGDLNPAGFGGLETGAFGLPAKPIPFPTRPRSAPKAKAAPAPPRQEPDGQHEESQRRLAETREDVHRLQRQLHDLRREAGELEGAAARARQAASKADRAWAEAREAAAKAEKAAAQARRVEEDAAEELAQARSRIDRAAEELERAEATVKDLRR